VVLGLDGVRWNDAQRFFSPAPSTVVVIFATMHLISSPIKTIKTFHQTVDHNNSAFTSQRHGMASIIHRWTLYEQLKPWDGMVDGGACTAHQH
jgi:hypothetical protein